jgi:hypothetical protein
MRGQPRGGRLLGSSVQQQVADQGLDVGALGGERGVPELADEARGTLCRPPPWRRRVQRSLPHDAARQVVGTARKALAAELESLLK